MTTRGIDAILSGPLSALLMLALVGLALIAVGALIAPDDEEPTPDPVWTKDNAINRRPGRR